jgi:serine/threonine protein kinase
LEKSNAGSLKFMAPEIFLGHTESTEKIDMWSLGCLLHAMILGEYPFSDSDKSKLKQQILIKVIDVSD